jgi:hypothetical protein
LQRTKIMQAFLSDPLVMVNSLLLADLFPIGISAAMALAFLVIARVLIGSRSPPAPSADVDAPEYDPFAQGTLTERRQSVRRAGNPVDVFYALPDNKDRPLTGWIFDRSVGGLGLIAAAEFEVGVTLLVRPVKAPATIPWIEVEVRCCRPTPDGKGCHVGCKFLQTPPWPVLLLFG